MFADERGKSAIELAWVSGQFLSAVNTLCGLLPHIGWVRSPILGPIIPNLYRSWVVASGLQAAEVAIVVEDRSRLSGWSAVHALVKVNNLATFCDDVLGGFELEHGHRAIKGGRLFCAKTTTL